MKQFLKDNLAIVAAIVLPLILVIVFALSTSVVNRIVADPQYDFLFATSYDVSIKGGGYTIRPN